MSIPREEAILLSAYTGFLLVQDFSDVHKFCEDTLGRSIWTHEFADEDVQKEIQDKLRPQIMKLIYSTNALRPVSRDRIEKVWSGCHECSGCELCIWNETKKCNDCKNRNSFRPLSDFCPRCGKPLTDAAVEIVMERMEALKNDSTID